MKKLLLSMQLMGVFTCLAAGNGPFRIVTLAICTDDCLLPGNEQETPTVQCTVSGGQPPYTLRVNNGSEQVSLDGIFNPVSQTDDIMTITLKDSAGKELEPQTFDLEASLFQKVVLTMLHPGELSYAITARSPELGVEVTLRGPEGFTRTSSASAVTFGTLKPGNYTISLDATAHEYTDNYQMTLVQEVSIADLKMLEPSEVEKNTNRGTQETFMNDSSTDEPAAPKTETIVPVAQKKASVSRGGRSIRFGIAQRKAKSNSKK